MHHVTFLQDLAVVMIVAGLVTILFHRLKQPVVLGYIIAGVIIGPHTPPFTLLSDPTTIETLSELGVIFLMFSLGLEFSLRKLKEVGSTAIIAATLEIILLFGAGFEIGRFFGWAKMDCIFLGAIMSISSTTIIIKALEELGKKKEKFASMIFGILIVEDILAIIMLALLSGIAKTGSLQTVEIARTVTELGTFLVVLLVAGLILVPRLLNYVARFKSNEMLLVTVLGLCFGVSLVAVKLGYSVALGAFVIGAVIAEARQIGRIETLMQPVRDMFSAVFFVSIGLLIDPKLLLQYGGPTFMIAVAVVVGKVIACSLGAFIGGNSTRTSMRVGMGVAQIGEFSFIIASLGLTLKVTSGFLYPIAVAVSAITTLLTPYLIMASDPAVAWFDRVAPTKLKNYLDAYTAWAQQLRAAGPNNPAKEQVRGALGQVILNLIFTTAVFIGAAFIGRRGMQWWPAFPGGENGLKALLWIVAMISSMPFLIMVLRKFLELARLLSQITAARGKAGVTAERMRRVITATVLILGLLAVLLVIFSLSVAILPSRNMVIVSALVLVAVAVLFGRMFIRIYNNAEVALAETLTQELPPHARDDEEMLPALLREAQLSNVIIPLGSHGAGKLIGELKLRTETAASIVGIERSHLNLINPGPDEELQPGDIVLLIGRPQEVDAAREFLTKGGFSRLNAEGKFAG